MFHAFFLSLGQLLDRRVAAVFLKSLLVTLLFFGAAAVAVWFGMHRLTELVAHWLGGWSWAADFANIATIILVFLLHWLLFRAISIAVIGLFADEVVEAVEQRHYPKAAASVRHVPFVTAARMGLASGTRSLGYNLILTPLYLLAHVFAPAAFFVVNAWLLGRDLGDMVAVRHMGVAELPRWRSRTRFRRFALGAFGTALLLIPIVNFLAPVLGAAMAAHAFHLRARR